MVKKITDSGGIDKLCRLFADKISKKTDAPTILFDSAGDNTSEKIMLSDNVNNYETIEVIYGLNTRDAGGSANSAKYLAKYQKFLPLFIIFSGGIGITFYTSLCMFSGNYLLRGTQVDNNDRDRRIEIDHGTSGALNFKGATYKSADGFAIYIYRVIGYK